MSPFAKPVTVGELLGLCAEVVLAYRTDPLGIDMMEAIATLEATIDEVNGEDSG